MKNLSILLMALFAVFLISCGGGENQESAEEAVEEELAVEAGKQAQIAAMKAAGATDEEIEEAMDQLSEMAKNIEEMEEEEESDEVFSDKNVELLGLNISERVITDEEWERAKVLNEKWRDLTNEDLRALTTEKIEELVVSAGFSDLETAKPTLSKMADGRENITSITMKIGMLMSTRMLDGKEVYEKEMGELGAKVNDLGYSVEDLKLMDENLKVLTSMTEIQFRLNNM